MSDAPSAAEAEADRWDDDRHAEWDALTPGGRADYDDYADYCNVWSYLADAQATDDGASYGSI